MKVGGSKEYLDQEVGRPTNKKALYFFAPFTVRQK